MLCTISKGQAILLIQNSDTYVKPQDVRGCIEQLQTVEKEERLLQESHKELGGLRDDLEGKKIELSELRLKREVRSSALS